MSEDHEPVWVDVVTLVVPRLTVSQMAESLFTHARAVNLKFRWVVHIDPVPEMSGDLPACMDEVGRLSKMFDDADIAKSEHRIGHPASFFNAMSRTCNPCLYLEDDKVFTRSPPWPPVLAGDVDFLNLKSKRVLYPNTCAGVWSRRAVDYALACQRHFKGNIEVWLKGIFRQAQPPLRRMKGVRCTMDIGAESLARHGLVRVMTEDGNPVYVKGGDVTFVVWEENAPLERLEDRRRGTLCTESYPSVGIRKGELLDLSRITTPFAFLISSDAFPENKSKSVSASEEAFASVDLVGNPEDPLLFAVARTSLFRGAASSPARVPDILTRVFQSVRPDRIRRVPLFATRGGSMHSNKRLRWLKENNPARAEA